jgi:lysophospholipase L1-like esterase
MSLSASAAARMAATGIAAATVAALALPVRQAAAGLRRGRTLAAHTLPYERECGDDARALLVLGDSLAVGVGAMQRDHSVAGRVAAAHRGITVHNLARTGARMVELRHQLRAAPRPHYEVLIAAAGANDVLRATSFSTLVRDLERFLAEAVNRASLVVMMNGANVGGAPVLPWYVRGMFTARSRRIRDATALACAQTGASFVDFFAEPGSDPFTRDPARYFAVDGLHPSSESYRVCWERVRALTLVDALLAAGA